ncbi:conjugal transfer protein TraF [Duganella vulcania]|uniref:Conjugal transfer protein TraF n=1 Tax=Duganella vulcania TaxID=2692166 RepID=A0A845GFI0_9BURK|nr:conjugal transfer protein TraF [Duganella vulcania]MYM92701.1 conjugal transfer protein TraF [Duganella vulcania]
MKPITRASILGILAMQLFAGTVAHAADSDAFYVQKERGWFWREPEPEADGEHPAKPQPVAPRPEPAPMQQKPAAPPTPAPFSTKWFRENLDKYREQAIDNPTKENVTAYIALQRVMLDKASTFSDVWQEVILQDTDFNESKRRPSSSAGSAALDEQALASKTHVAQAVAERVGVWFFFRSDCSACDVQLNALQGLAERYHFKVLPVSLDGRPLIRRPKMQFVADKGQANQMGVESLPSIFAVVPPSSYVKLTEWVASTDELVERLLVVSKTLGLIDEPTMASTRPVVQTKVSSNFGRDMDQKILDDRQSLTDYIRKEIRSSERAHSR